MKIHKSIKISENLIKSLETRSEKENRSFNNMVEVILEKSFEVCEHEMVVCDEHGRIPITGEPFRGASYAICRKCGERPNYLKS